MKKDGGSASTLRDGFAKGIASQQGELPESLLEDLERADLEARALFPDVELDAAAYGQALGERIAEGELPPTLAAVHTSDVFLANAAAAGDAAAQDALYRGPLAQVAVALRRAQVPEDAARDLVQHVLLYILAPGEDGRVRLLQFRGRGELVAWLRVIATRELHHRTARGQREGASADETLLQRIGGTHDPELELLRHKYRSEFKRAVEDGLRELNPRERTLLRYQLLDGLEQEQMGALYGVHRVTVARWLAAARASLWEKTRALLSERLGLDTAELRSALRLVRSELDLSLHGVLASQPPTAPR